MCNASWEALAKAVCVSWSKSHAAPQKGLMGKTVDSDSFYGFAVVQIYHRQHGVERFCIKKSLKAEPSARFSAEISPRHFTISQTRSHNPYCIHQRTSDPSVTI